MTEQMTEAGAFLLVAAVAAFWIAVAALVRLHAYRRRTHDTKTSASGAAL